MVTAVTPLNGPDYFEGPIFGVYSQVDQRFVRDTAPHLFSVFEPPPYFFLYKVLHTSFCVVLHSHISVDMPAVFPSIFWCPTAEILLYQRHMS